MKNRFLYRILSVFAVFALSIPFISFCPHDDQMPLHDQPRQDLENLLYDVLTDQDVTAEDQCALITELAQDGCNLNVEYTDHHNMTPLMIAIERGRLPVVSQLITLRAPINARTSSGWTAIMIAAITGNLEMVQRLYALGANIRYDRPAGNLLHQAARSGNVDLINYVLSLRDPVTGVAFFSVDTPSAVTHMTPLMYAAQGGHLAAVNRLLERGSDVNLGTVDDMTVLDYAVQGAKDVVDQLSRDASASTVADAVRAYEEIVRRLILLGMWYNVGTNASINLMNRIFSYDSARRKRCAKNSVYMTLVGRVIAWRREFEDRQDRIARTCEVLSQTNLIPTAGRSLGLIAQYIS